MKVSECFSINFGTPNCHTWCLAFPVCQHWHDDPDALQRAEALRETVERAEKDEQ
jgi:hypothetical protein